MSVKKLSKRFKRSTLSATPSKRRPILTNMVRSLTSLTLMATRVTRMRRSKELMLKRKRKFPLSKIVEAKRRMTTRA